MGQLVISFSSPPEFNRVRFKGDLVEECRWLDKECVWRRRNDINFGAAELDIYGEAYGLTVNGS